MNCNDILSQHQELQSIVFRVEHRGMQVEAVLSCLLPSGLAVEITAPRELAGLEAHCCHIPGFGDPTLRGYVYRGALTAKALDCLRRALIRRIEGHLFLQEHRTEVRKIFKKAANEVYRKAMDTGQELYDYTTFKQLRAPLLRRYKSGLMSQKEYQQALRKLKQPWERHDDVYWEVECRFYERMREEFPKFNGRVYPQNLFKVNY